jgi:putative lipoprotein
MIGVYRFEAGLAEFTECSTGQRWSVTTTDAAGELRAAAARAGGRAANAVFATVEGRVTARAPATGQLSLDVARVVNTTAGRSCAARFASVPLEKTSWRLTRLGGAAVPAQPGLAAAPGLVFRDDSGSFGGNGGCNRVTGGYQTNGEDLRLQGIGTLKACPTVTDRETLFRSALNDTRSYRILGRTLELFNGDRQAVARFEAVD